MDEIYIEELINGEIVKYKPRPSIFHALAFSELLYQLGNYRYDINGLVVPSQTIFFDEQNTFRADICVVCDRSIIKDGHIHGAPDLVVEILSKSTKKYDRGHKRVIYGKYGVKEYWLVDITNFSIEIYENFDGNLEITDDYAIVSEKDFNALSKEEQENYTTVFNSKVFPDMEIDLEIVFKDVQELM